MPSLALVVSNNEIVNIQLSVRWVMWDHYSVKHCSSVGDVQMSPLTPDLQQVTVPIAEECEGTGWLRASLSFGLTTSGPEDHGSPFQQYCTVYSSWYSVKIYSTLMHFQYLFLFCLVLQATTGNYRLPQATTGYYKQIVQHNRIVQELIENSPFHQTGCNSYIEI